MTPGRIDFRSVTVKECIMAAFELRTYQVSGPSSLTSERYDISATAAGPASAPDLRIMLRQLLADRFSLAKHMERRELPAYSLMAAKNRPKLTPSTGNEKSGYALEGGSVVFHDMSMTGLADYLSQRGPIDRPVIDKTGLEGPFDFRLQLFDAQPDMPLDALKRAYFQWDQGSSIFTDLQEQLGLKLKPERDMVDVLVVDALSKPSEN